MASRVAAEINKENDVEAETVNGGFHEFSVYIDGQKVIDTNRFWYPTPSKIVAEVKAILAE